MIEEEDIIEVDVIDSVDNTVEEVKTETEFISPKDNCKDCLGKGQVHFWDSKQKGTYKKEMYNSITSHPCQCLIEQYRKMKTIIQPEFKVNNNKMQIILTKVV